MVISHKSRFAPHKFKGNIKSIPLNTIIDLITFTCILKINNGENSGSLLFDNGNLIGARFNNEFNIHKTEDILKWKIGTYSYQKWTNNFEIDIKQLIDVLYLIEIAYLDAKIYIFQNEKLIDIRCSEGKIVSINPKPKDLNKFLKKVFSYEKGKILIELNSGQTGDLKLYFTDLFNNLHTQKESIKNYKMQKPLFLAKNKKKSIKKEIRKSKLQKAISLDSQIKEKKVVKQNKNISTNINKKIVIKCFDNLIEILGETLIAGSIFTTNNAKPVYSYKSETNQTLLFANLGSNLNTLLKNSGYAKLNQYYLLDMQKDYIAFVLIFKEHHFELLLKKTEIKLGYLFNIIKPILISDYKEAIKNPI